MHEDISSGLLPISELGRLARVPTPLIDAHICIAETIMGRNYHEEGVNLRKMGFEGMTVEEALTYIENGDGTLYME